MFEWVAWQWPLAKDELAPPVTVHHLFQICDFINVAWVCPPGYSFPLLLTDMQSR